MKKKFHDQKPSGKDILRGFISPQFEASLSESTLRNLSSPTLFLRELQKLCWRTLTYFNICMDQHLRTDVEDFDTQTSGSTYAPAHRKEKVFFRLDKKERDSPCSV